MTASKNTKFGAQYLSLGKCGAWGFSHSRRTSQLEREGSYTEGEASHSWDSKHQIPIPIKDQLKEINFLKKIGQGEISPKTPQDFYIQTAAPIGGGFG